jgi:hypothetical protein
MNAVIAAAAERRGRGGGAHLDVRLPAARRFAHVFRRGPDRTEAFASRPKDWMDVDGVIVRQAGRLDWSYVERQLAPLAALKEEPELMDALTRRRLALDR